MIRSTFLTRAAVTVYALHLSICLLLPATAAADAPTVGHAEDRDGDGRPGEDQTILERFRLEHQIHGNLTSARQLERTRWGYDRWLEARAKAIEGNGWISLGPNNGAGRVPAIAPHPVVEGVLLAGAAGGGLWRSEDEGRTWTPLTDGLSDLSVGAVAYAPDHPDIIYLGTGEGGYAIDFIPGIGLLRSDDGGNSWFLPQGVDEIVASQFFDLEIVHPNGSDPSDPATHVVLAATNDGLYRSDDGGINWSTAIAGTGLVGVTEILRPDPAYLPNLLFTALWCQGTCPEGTARVMRSENGGLTWTRAAEGLPATASISSRNRTSITATRDGEVLYAGLNLPTGDRSRSVIYRSDDGGASWSVTADAGDYLAEQGWYDNTITVHPADPNSVVAGGVWYVTSDDGGASWRSVPPASRPHVDAHDLQWQGDTLWVGCDGGVWRSTDRGRSWQARNDGLVTRQFYGIALDPIERQRVIGGTQDNGTNLRRIDGGSFEEIIGGDGFECAVNPWFSDIMYATKPFGRVFRSFDAFATSEEITPPYGHDDAAPFLSLLTLRHDQPNVLFTGSTLIWRSTDAGSTWEDLPTTMETGDWSTAQVRAIAITAADDQLLLTAKGPNVYSSVNAGESWRLTAVGYTLNSIDISSVDPMLVLAATANGGASGRGVMLSDNGGVSFRASGEGLPHFAVQVVRWDPTDPLTAYAGTDVGLYRSTDGGASWARFGDGLPAASVHDLGILPDGSMLRVATHGRGIWELQIDTVENKRPTVEITVPSEEIAAEVGDVVSLAAFASDSDGDELAVTWVVGSDWRTLDGGTGTGSVTSSLDLELAMPGAYFVAARVEDGRGGAAYDFVDVIVYESADDCSTPRVIPEAGPFPEIVITGNGSASAGTSDPIPQCVPVGTGRSNSLWFEFTPTESATYEFATCGSSADTVLSVWTGDACGPYTEVEGGCNRDDDTGACGGSPDSWLALDLEAFTTYQITVASYSPAFAGTVVLEVDCPECTGEADTFQYIVAAAANAPGTGGTYWVTDLNLFNPGTEPVTAELTFLSSGEGEARSVTVEGGTALEEQDVVGGLLGTEGSGALRIVASRELLVGSRTYNNAASGTFGQFIPGTDHGLGPGASVDLIGLVRDEGFRTNIGIANASDEYAVVSFELFSDGASGAGFLSTGPWSWSQWPWALYTGSSMRIRLTNQSNTTVSVYASVVDESTGDPTYVTAPAKATADDGLWIPAAAHADGVGSSVWRTDLVLANLGDEAVDVIVELHKSDREVPELLVLPLTLPAGSTVGVGDVIGAPGFGVNGTGALRIAVHSGEVLASSRTYNQTENGTYGQLVPGVLESSFAGDDDVIVLTQLHQGVGFRTNVGLVNRHSEIEVRIRFFDVDGSELGSRTVTVPTVGHIQLNGAVPYPGTAGGFAVLECTTEGGRFFAYASVIDRGSGDPVFIPGKVLRD